MGRSKVVRMVVLALLFAVPAQAQVDVGCQTSKCHDTMGTQAWVHGPVGAGACLICHVLAEGEEHEFSLRAEKEELCFACHEISRDMMLEDSVHTPVADGDCTGCHDPHESDHRFMLKGTAADLCYQCHGSEKFAMDFVHGPVASGDCNVCHNPHASPFAKQLVDSPEEICFSCHVEQADLREKRHVHSPVQDDCVNCHNPHSNVARFMLPDDPPGLCFSCHEDVANESTSPIRHEPVISGQCDACHDPHSSDNPKLYPVAANELCFQCHDELGDYIAEQSHLHGPVQQGDCSACHNPHGSDFHKILRKAFPEGFYEPYAEENYAICFECHNSQIASSPETKSVTDFRDGELNLHYLHVNKKEKGRSCRACHQVHASSQEKHVRTSVPYGSIGWELPVTFTKTKDGGSCQVGCHAPKSYSRK